MFKNVEEVRAFIEFMIQKKVLSAQIGDVKLTLSNGALYPGDYGQLPQSRPDSSTLTEGKPVPGNESAEPFEDEDTLFHSAE